MNLGSEPEAKTGDNTWLKHANLGERNWKIPQKVYQE
jgi:hypothetical protein